MSLWTEIADRIGKTTGEPFRPRNPASAGGGCINAAFRLSDGRREYFAKLNDASLADMFEAEADGLRAMADTHTVRVPEPVCWGIADGQAYIVLEALDLGGNADMEALGRQLAAMHRHTSDRFGWFRDNTIGSTRQPNEPAADWLTFWRERRLGFQLDLAAGNGHGGSLQSGGRELMERLPDLLADHEPAASLLHGDLWSGNYAALRDGTPVIFDPATYYGDREADLAMTELFGNFGSRFYSAYNEAWPLDAGYRVRKTLYNLYHIINHLNLFGGGYRHQAESMIGRLLSELR